MEFSNRNRAKFVQCLKESRFDVLVIGGGITGAGIALDAADRGMTTALVEMQDFASGTSSRSTKLVHGGLRYLKQFEVKMVADVGKERAIVYENGPHVTTPEWMLLPIYKGGTFGKLSTSIGLKLYDFLAGVKKSERRKMLNFHETIEKEPLLKKEDLIGGGYYVEYRTDDARLTLEVVKGAFQKGAFAVNYTKVTKFLYQNGKVAGVEVQDQLSQEKYEILAEKVVNATGPWVDTLRELDRSKKGKMLQLTKGVHLVLDQSRFPLRQAVYFDTPDGRMIFAIPRDGKTYVGTTDTIYNGDTAHPFWTSSDVRYILKAMNFMFPGLNFTENDIETSWAGLRPLIFEEGKSLSEISRKDEIWESQSGLLTISGGKLTGYRKMAEHIVDLLCEKLRKESIRILPSCNTKNLPISGGDIGGSKNFNKFLQIQATKGLEYGISKEDARHLASMYGSNVEKLFHYINEEKEIAGKFELPILLFAKLKYALEEEMAVSPVDFFYRRTGDILFNIFTVKKYQENVIQYMAEYFNWNSEITSYWRNQLEKELLDTCSPSDEKSS